MSTDEQCGRDETTEGHGLIPYGPVPSRRLGRSMGINNIPPKICTYSCAYCQVGRTLKKHIDRQPYYDPDLILREVERKMEKIVLIGEAVDYLTFVPDGEPTLDANLGREIDLLRSIGIKIGVITNASLLWREDVVEELSRADWVSVKIDSVMEDSWKKINRPHAKLRFTSIMDGLAGFARSYDGELATETMMVKGINDDADSANTLSEFLARIQPSRAYLSIPTRPPAEAWVRLPAEADVNRVFQIVSGKLDRAELLTGYEGNAFVQTGDVKTDLLAVTAVHPMREEAVRDFLAGAHTDWRMIDDLIHDGLIAETEYEGRRFYMRRFPETGCTQD
ncbi:MAG: radical SAM protein [Desulfomonilaceae bacterium]|nr:radical SAM protein [Desulfomonilaceae bacterium]